MSPLYLLADQTDLVTLYALSITFVTIVSVVTCRILSRFHLVALEFMLPVNVILRGFVSLAFHKPIENNEAKCISTLLDLGLRNANLLLFLGETVMFRTNIWAYFFLIAPVFGFFAATERAWLTKIDMPNCDSDWAQQVFLLLMNLPLSFPSFYALYSQT